MVTYFGSAEMGRIEVLKGPIPWGWLDRAGRLSGKALAVGLVLWHYAGMTRRRSIHV